MKTRREHAFRKIQDDPILYRLWCDAKTESERTDLLIDRAWCLGYIDGIKFGEEIGERRDYERGYNDAY